MTKQTIKVESEVTIFITSDGQTFPTQAQADAHEHLIKQPWHKPMDKYFQECLTDRWIFFSLADFIPCVGNGFTDDDGCGEFLMCSIKYGTVFRQGWDDLYELQQDSDDYDELDKTIERLRKKYDNKDEFILGVLWYNKYEVYKENLNDKRKSKRVFEDFINRIYHIKSTRCISCK